jgi:hypothetical protein
VFRAVTESLVGGQLSSSKKLPAAQLDEARGLLLQTENLGANLGILFSRLRGREQTADVLDMGNDVLRCLGFMARAALPSLGRMVAEDKGLTAVMQSLPCRDLHEGAAALVELLSENAQATDTMYKGGISSFIAQALALEVSSPPSLYRRLA